MNAKRAAAMIMIKADSKGLARDLAGAKKQLRGFGNDAKKVTGSLFGGVKAGAGFGLGMAGLGGIADIVGGMMDFQKSLLRMRVAAGMSSAEMDKVRESVLGTSKATAISKEEVLAGGHAYLAATSDAAGLVDMMNLLAKTAQATGAKTEDLANVAAKLRDNFNINNVADMEKALSGLTAQGNAGSVELNDLASTLASVAPMFADFGSLGGVAGAGELGAAMQVVAKGFGDPKEAATGLRSMMSGLTQNAERFEKAGVKIFDKDPKTGEKRMRNLSAIWQDINTSKLVKDPTLLGKAFGQQEASRAYQQLKKYPELYDKLIAAGQDYGTVSRDFATVMSDPITRAEQAINSMKVRLAEAFTPDRIESFADALEDVAAVFAKIVDAAEFLFGHAIGESGYSKWQEKELGKFTGGLTDREREAYAANIGPGGILEGTGEGSVTQAALKGGVMSQQIPQSLADKINAHQALMRQHPGRIAMTEAGAARRAVETSQESQLATLMQENNKLLREQIHATKKLADRPVSMSRDVMTHSNDTRGARGGGYRP